LEINMAKPQVSFAKRQREQAKRERQQMKAARRAERKTSDPDSPADDIESMEPLDGPLEIPVEP
jgi:sRNA-binding protein